MAYNIKFVRGVASQYKALATKDSNTLYFITDEGALYLGDKEYTNGNDLAQAIRDIATNASDIEDIKTELAALTGGDEEGAAGSISDMISTAVDDLQTEVIGDTTDLDTEADTLVGAVNELNSEITALETNKTVVVEAKGTANAGYAKTYVVKQGGTSVGEIDIPKDMVVSAGEVVTLSEAEAKAIDSSYVAGKYIKLTIANKDQSELYIPVAALVDIYTADNAANAIVNVTVDNTTNKISATVNAGTITSTELAANAVVEGKIADGAVTTDKIADAAVTADKLAINSVVSQKIASEAVTKGKLSQEVRDLLDSADSAVQSVVEGETNGTIKVDDTPVSVHGLGTAAYTSADAYDEAGAANTVKTALEGTASDSASSKTIAGAKAYADSLADNYDASGSANTAESNAKAYTDTALTWGTIA